VSGLVDDLACGVGLAVDHAAYEVDWTGRFRGSALAVALPATTAEVAHVLTTAARHAVGVTVAGGRTGLVGGAVPDGNVVLSTERLGGVDVDGATALAGAGATLADVQRAARDAGWDYGVDMASRQSATVGGTVATNAGGLHGVAHGTTRAQVLGVEAVLPDGSVLRRLHGLAKDATGYDLGHLLVGSEGTLGVVTRVRLRLVPPPGPQQTALLPVESVAAAVALVDGLRRGATGLRAVELLLRRGVELVAATTGLPRPATSPAYLLVEAAELGAVPDDAVVATDAADAARLWALREGMTEALATLGPAVKLDVSLPAGAVAAFVDGLPEQAHVFGHLADGNLHVALVGGDEDDEERVLRRVAELGGSIGAEHGVGRAKRRHLHLSRTPQELAAMRAVKDALDPTGLLGPGVLLPDR
jgi:FAD/FMN-containing dehydrogenase